MAWIESHDQIGDHPKTLRLATLLGVRVPEAVGLLHLLWHFTLRYAWRDGDLKRFKSVSISKNSKYEGSPAKFINCLQKAGFLDGFKVHDWLDFSGRLVADRIRYEKANKTRTEPVRNPYVVPPVSVANLTLPDLTNLTKPKEGREAARAIPPPKPTATAAPPSPSLAAPNPTAPETAAATAPYEVPLPETDPIGTLIVAYKVLKGFKFDDRRWDRHLWNSAGVAAKAILDLFSGDFKMALRFLEEKASDFKKRGKFEWRINWIVPDVHDWKLKAGGGNGTDDNGNRESFSRAVAQRRAEAGNPGKRSNFSMANDVLDSCGYSPLPEHHDGQGNKT